jgi:hypothetical protein
LAIIAIGGILTGAYLKVEHDGYVRGSTEVKKQWDAAIAADIKRGEDARREAEQYVVQNPPVIYPATPATPTAPKQPPVVSVPNDKWNRDQSSVRPMAPHHLFSLPRHSANSATNPSPQQDGTASKVLVSCTTIRWALKNLSKDTLDAYNQSASPKERAHAKDCQGTEK